jgi:hypothetical protein
LKSNSLSSRPTIWSEWSAARRFMKSVRVAPLAVFAFHQPVDQLVGVAVDLARGVGDDLALERGAQLVAVDQIENVPDAQRLVEELVAALGEGVEHVLHMAEMILEVAAHVGFHSR